MNPEYKLYDYQHEVIDWMNEIKTNNINGSQGGIINLKMGYGKCLIALEYIRQNKIKPNLIICSKTLINEWENQIKKFYKKKTFKYIIFHKSNKKIENYTVEDLKKYDIILITYTTILYIDKYLEGFHKKYIEIDNDTHMLEIKKNTKKLSKNIKLKGEHELVKGINLIYSIVFENVICDEIHNISNFKTKTFKSIYSLASNYRFGLTGTLIRNKKTELITIIKYLNVDDYNYPFYWTKKLIIKEEYFKLFKEITYEIVLPELKINIKKIKFNKDEKMIYEIYTNKIKNIIDENDQSSYIQIIALFTRLRQICLSINLINLNRNSINQYKKILKIRNHPNIYCDDCKCKYNRRLITNFDNSKYEEIKEIINDIKERKEKIIIFSSFTSYLKLLNKELNGTILLSEDSIEKRSNKIKEWKKNETILLLNYKIGSEGLNLIEANNIILCDTWWNVSLEQQAIARVYRNGQNKKVNVYRLIIENTIEELIYKKSQTKLNLYDKFKNNEKIEEIKITRTLLLSLLDIETSLEKLTLEDDDMILD